MKQTPAAAEVQPDPVPEAERIQRQLLAMVDTLEGLVLELREHMQSERQSDA